MPAKNILIWYSLGDCLVIEHRDRDDRARDGHRGARAVGEDAVWGMPAEGRPARRTASTIYDEHPTPLPPDTNMPPSEDNGTHSGVNRNPSALRQVEAFLLGSQQVIQTCGNGDTGAVRLRDRRLQVLTGRPRAASSISIAICSASANRSAGYFASALCDDTCRARAARAIVAATLRRLVH